MYEGGCLCGACRYTVDAAPVSVCICHCKSCRKASGAPFVAWASFPAPRLRFTGDDLVYYGSSPRVERGACGRCGTAITYTNDAMPGYVDVTVSTLDAPEAVRPEFHVWVSHKLPWIELRDGLPRYEEWRVEPEKH